MSTIESTIAELESYRALEAGWDEPDSPAPKADDIERALAFVRTLPTELAAPVPMISSSSAQIGLYWDGLEQYVDVEIEPDGVISVFVCRHRPTRAEQYFADLRQADFTLDFFNVHFGQLRSKQEGETNGSDKT